MKHEVVINLVNGENHHQVFETLAEESIFLNNVKDIGLYVMRPDGRTEDWYPFHSVTRIVRRLLD